MVRLNFSIVQIIYLIIPFVKKNISFNSLILRLKGFIIHTIVLGGCLMDYVNWFPKRITELRMQKGVSARDMSLSLGQSESYINKIENKRAMPSMTGFFYICEYLGVSPQEFFNIESSAPEKEKELFKALNKLTAQQMEHMLLIIKDIIGDK